MTIVQLANAYGPRTGGIRTHLDHVRAGYAALGARTVLIIPGERDESTDDAYGRVIRLASPRFALNRDYRNLYRHAAVLEAVRAASPDSVEIIDKYTLPRLGPMLRRWGLPVIGFSSERLDQVMPPYVGASRPVLGAIRRYNRWFCRRFDRVVSHSAYNAAELFAVGADNIEVVPLGVDLDRNHPARRDEDERRRLLAGRRVLLTYAGRLVSEKRVEVLAAMMRRLEGWWPGRFRLVVAGAGPREADLAGAPGTTLLGFVGDRDALARLYASGDLFVHPSPIETFPLGILEALAAGCPVVGAAGGGVGEMVDRRVGEAARADGDAFAAAVDRVARRPRAGLSAAARARAERFPWPAACARLLAVHQALRR